MKIFIFVLKALFALLLLFLIYRLIPSTYVGLQEERDMARAIDKYAEQLGKKYCLQFLTTLNVTHNDNANYGAKYISDKKIELSESRVLAANTISEFVDFLRHNKVMKEYCEWTQKEYKKAIAFTNSEDIKEYVGYSIAFWDKEVNRINPPYIADILFENGIIKYSVADPKTQALKVIYEETLDEAKAFRDKSVKEKQK